MTSSEPHVEDPSAVIEEKELIRFDKAQEYLSLLSILVPSAPGTSTRHPTPPTPSTPSVTQDDVLAKLIAILDEYQDQSNLLDPYLERIVLPPVESLQRHVRSNVSFNGGEAQHRLTPEAVTRQSKLVYAYTKVRGYKTIVHYFPHEVADLPATLSFLEKLQRLCEDEPDSTAAVCWELRYVCLLWLSLICMIPFDLAKFDRSVDGIKTTASRIAAVAAYFIASPGKERDAAAVVLGRLFQRSDVQLKDHFGDFLASSLQALQSERLSPFRATGILQALCEVLKTSESAFVLKHLSSIQELLDAYDAPTHSALASNGLITKYQTKLNSRLALKLLRPRNRRYANKYHVLGASVSHLTPSTPAILDDDDEDESDTPEEVESMISYLIEALQNKDTVVRYSAAKGLARICDRLPTSFLDQVVDAMVSLFHINIPDLYSGARDLSSVSEHTWQGACMALAELSRRGLLFAQTLSEALPWILKALLFDVRRGAHSVGANVRDAACYVVWALARSNDTESIRPHALDLAKRLVAVATLDRDVSIRRAASAAFQESVGRLALFPHGIDVIRMTDFYAVSVRRNAFLECAIKVAAFEEYREYLLDHLIEIVTVHWDPAMRGLGAQAVARIAMHDAESLLPEITVRLGKRIGTSDNAVLHGTLLTLAEVCRISRTSTDGVAASKVRASCFDLLDAVRPTVFRSLGAASILQAACQLIGSSFSHTTTASPNESQTWEKVINLALARQEEPVHIAAAEAISQLSTVVNLSTKIRSTLDNWSSLTIPQQQSNALLLGALDFSLHDDLFVPVVEHLIALGTPSTKTIRNELYSPNIEVRRNASDSIARALISSRSTFNPNLIESVIRALLTGLQDYSTDQRGDVGSWVRLSSLSGLKQILILCRQRRQPLLQELFQDAVGGMWKQAAERIDHVRHAAGLSVLEVYHAYGDAEQGCKPLGYDVVADAFGSEALTTGEDGVVGMRLKDPRQAFPRICHLLVIERYRTPILEGLIVSVGSKSDLGERIIGPALTSLTTSASTTLPLTALLNDLFQLAKSNFGNNRIFIPCTTTVNLLLENGASQGGLERDALIRWLKMTMTNVAKIKAVQRVVVSATLAANAVLAIKSCESDKDDLVEILRKASEVFLGHPFPTVRVKMAEQLYAVLSSSCSFDDAEEGEDESEGKSKMQVWEELEAALLDTKWGATTGADVEAIRVVTTALPRVLE
ncbi:tubulin specific chaperone cofactor [Pseudozyma hubeiensis SY62]|uniref:Tubulin specific chaperone cofactor n=1 Tax=Pseudozyma hubeiensis (strain SY62) TaxID=1305764 RepID=R9P2C9_PSEHS|nr:tubulin specific chaperone cofactor [Pseudozyma hubeiensis SY62]GAC95548.1 tubulin specific chaperone cofactor [Pseudozyma hubeiensis SY62]